MARGEGLEVIKEYDWTQQKNNCYTIFNVELFSTYERTIKNEQGQDEKKQVTVEDLHEFVKLFDYKKNNRFFYPRAHISHHNDNDDNDRENAGFIDFMYVEGNIIYGDLVEIPEDVFMDIHLRKKYPYRSVEISKDGSIGSIALLQSKISFFDFPLLITKKEEKKQSEDEQKFCYVRSNIFSQVTEKANVMEEPEKKDCFSDEEIEEYKKFKKFRAAFEKEGQDDETENFSEDEMEQYSKFKKYMKKYSEDESKDLSTVDKSEADKPPKVETYSAKEVEKLKEKIAKMERQINGPDDFERLQKICQTNPTLKYSDQLEKLEKIATKEGRKIHLDLLEQESGLTRNNSNSALGLLQNAKVRDKGILEKFSGETDHIKNVASKLADNWEDTAKVNPSFKQRYPDKLKFVESKVEDEKECPGFCESNGLI